MFTASVVHWRAFKHNKEADNGSCETLNAHDLQLLAFIDNKEKGNSNFASVAIVHKSAFKQANNGLYCCKRF